MTLNERAMRDAIEWSAVDRENGFRHLRAGQPGAHGLFPVWNGAGLRHQLAVRAEGAK